MKYTISKKADKKVEQDLEIIQKIILKNLNPISILLFGGFGKGEGSFEIKNNQAVPLNDYDLYIITKKKLADEYLEKLSLACSKAINKGGLDFVEFPDQKYNPDKFFHVDLRCIPYNKLQKLLPTQRTFELKHSMVIYGENVLPKIPDVKIPVSDAIRLLFNKMDHLLLSQNNTKQIKLTYASKAFLDSCAALLIFTNQFHYSYRERNKIFQKTSFPAEFKKYVSWATKFKLRVSFKQNADFYWEKARYWTGYSLKYILKNHLALADDSWPIIAKAIYYRLPYTYFAPYLPSKFFFPAQYYLTLKYILKCWARKEFIIKPLFSWKDIGLKLAIPVILYLYNEEKLSEYYLKKITSKTKPLKERALYLYGLYYLQKLI